MVALASPSVQSKAHQPREAQMVRYASGEIVALSLSQPGRTYRVQLDPASCECPGWQHRGCCYHVKAAAERFAVSACSWCGSVEAVRTFVNGLDGDALLVLCAGCLHTAHAPRVFWQSLQEVK